MSTGLEHSLWLIVLYTLPSSSVFECALLPRTDMCLLNCELWTNGKRKDGLLLESLDSWQRELLQCPHSWHCGFMNKNSLPDLGELLSVQCPLNLLVQECSPSSLRSQLRIAVTEETAQLWFFSCGQVQGKGLSLSFGHSGMVNLGRQVEHMAAPPMIGGLLMWRRRSGTGAKSFCLLTSGFSAWSTENFGHKSK